MTLRNWVMGHISKENEDLNNMIDDHVLVDIYKSISLQDNMRSDN